MSRNGPQAEAAAAGDALDFGGADLAAGLHGFSGQHELAALGGGGGDEGLEGGAEVAAGAGAVEARLAEIPAADQGEDGAGLGLGGDGGVLQVGGHGAGDVVLLRRVLPGFLALEVLDGEVEFGFEAFLPCGVERGVDVEAAEAGGFVVEDAVEFAADGAQGVGGLGFALFVVHEFDGRGGEGVAARLVDEAHGGHAVERLVALLDGGVEIAERREDVRAADDADEQGAFAVARAREVVFPKYVRGGLLDAIGAGAEVDAVEVMGEDLVFGIAGLDAQGEGDFEKLAVQGFLADVEAVAGELHGERGGALGEIAVLDVSDGRARRGRGSPRRGARKTARPRGRSSAFTRKSGMSLRVTSLRPLPPGASISTPLRS